MIIMTTTTKKKNNTLFIGCVLVLIGCIVLTLTVFQNHTVSIENESDTDYHHVIYKNQKYKYDTQIINILCMGIDSTKDQTGQADALQLYSLNRRDKTITVLSINRDTMTPIHLYDVSHNSLGWKKQHLALSYAYGANAKNGALLTCEAVSKMLFQIPVNKFIAIDLDQLDQIQDVVGSLSVVVPNNSLVDVNPLWIKGNTITINQDNVEDFLRSRDTNIQDSNVDRMERQRTYLNAYYQQLKEDLQTNKDEVMDKVYSAFDTLTNNITMDEISAYVKMFETYTYEDSKSYYELPGISQEGDMHDEFILNKKALKNLVLDLYYRKD